MCVVRINIDEATLRGLRPELNTPAAVRQWAQQQIDLCVKQIESEQRQNESQDDLWRAIEHDASLLLNPSKIVDDDSEGIDLETFRADLHTMIDDVYAEQ
jgi:hypothetical protein